MRRALFLALLVSLGLPDGVRADIGIQDVSATAARPGQVVSVLARGYPGRRPWRPMPVVMMPLRPYPQLRARRSELDPPRYRVVGAIRSWRPLRRNRYNASGRLRFRVPRVSPRRYVLGLFCESCVRGPGGSIIASRRFVLRVRA